MNMDKQRYKYSWIDKKWNKLYRVNNHVSVFTGVIGPDGSHRFVTFAGESTIANHYIREYSKNG